jgi:hypothetical protein
MMIDTLMMVKKKIGMEMRIKLMLDKGTCCFFHPRVDVAVAVAVVAVAVDVTAVVAVAVVASGMI